MTTFERIEKLRKEAGLSQGKLEKELGFSNEAFQNGKTVIPHMNDYKRLQISSMFPLNTLHLVKTKNHLKN